MLTNATSTTTATAPATGRRSKTPQELVECGMRTLNSRGAWESKQALFYELRHDGVRRQNKPWPKAADFHLALVDLTIRKQKAFWYGQVFQADRVATFVGKREQAKYLTTAAAEFYDYQIRHESNLLTEFVSVVDTMLLRGRGVMKAWVDPLEDNALKFESYEPQCVLMAPGANDFEDADWFIIVRTLTEGQYGRDPRWQVPYERVKGGEAAMANLNRLWQDKTVREGLTHARTEDMAIVWETWVQEARGQWRVHHLSPQCAETELRPSFLCPYKTPEGKASLPYFSFSMELKDRGWYSPRGLGEILAPFELLGCKIVNEWLDGLSFTSKPLFTAEGQLPNAGSIKFAPGEILPGNVKRLDMGPGNLELPTAVQFVQATAEQLAMMPDFGVGGERQQDNRTATEVDRIAQVMDVGTSFNGEMVRRVMQRVHAHCWRLLLAYQPKEMSYLLGDEAKTLPQEALHDAYSVRVGGRSDQWNAAQVFQRAAARYQLLAADPNVSHEELVRSLLTADDPEAARTLFVATDEKAADEAENEAEEIAIMAHGFAARVRANEDHAQRIHILLSWLVKQQETGAPLDRIAMIRVSQHLKVHLEYLEEVNPEQATEMRARALAAIAEATQAAQPASMPGMMEPGAEPAQTMTGTGGQPATEGVMT